MTDIDARKNMWWRIICKYFKMSKIGKIISIPEKVKVALHYILKIDSQEKTIDVNLDFSI